MLTPSSFYFLSLLPVVRVPPEVGHDVRVEVPVGEVDGEGDEEGARAGQGDEAAQREALAAHVEGAHRSTRWKKSKSSFRIFDFKNKKYSYGSKLYSHKSTSFVVKIALVFKQALFCWTVVFYWFEKNIARFLAQKISIV